MRTNNFLIFITVIFFYSCATFTKEANNKNIKATYTSNLDVESVRYSTHGHFASEALYSAYEKYNREGKIVEEGSYLENDNGEKILSKTPKLEEETFGGSKFEKTFNEQGLLTKMVNYYLEGLFKDSFLFKQIRTYRKDGTIKNEYTYQSSIDTLESGYERLIRGLEIDNSYIVKRVSTDTVHYNAAGNKIYCNFDGFGFDEIYYKYNKENLLIEEKRITEDNDMITRTIIEKYTYNNFNDVIRIDSFTKKDSITISKTLTITYKYDSYGNWIERKTLNEEGGNRPMSKDGFTNYIDEQDIQQMFPFVTKDLVFYSKRDIEYFDTPSHK